MRLVESDTAGPTPAGDAAPPRPEHRRVSVSLLFSLSVLAGTVIAVYVLFPAHSDRMLARAMSEHRRGGPFAIEAPTARELAAWSVGALGADAPWPRPGLGRGAAAGAAPGVARGVGGSPPRVEIIGVRTVDECGVVLGVVRYRLDGDEVTVAIQRAASGWLTPARRRDGGDLAVAWRCGPWACVAVGPETTSARWRAWVGAH